MNADERRHEAGDAALDRAIARLPRDLEPARDLWPAIETRLDEPAADGRAGYWPWMGVAAAVLVLAALPLLLPNRSPAPAEETVPVATAPPGEAVPVTTVPAVDDQGRPALRLRPAAVTSVQPGPEYEAARAELLGLLEERLAGLAPEDREIVVRNIETIRNALEEIDTSLQKNPDHPLLQEMLLSTYQRELDVMSRVNGLTEPAMRRTDL